MKTLVLLLSLTLSASCLAQNIVTATITNFKSNKGFCHACIFENAASFQKMEALSCVSVPVKDQKTTVTFENLADGSYAIFVFHDENNNKKMDRNFLGIPREGYGASSNKLPFASAPRFSENKFSLSNKASLQLNIRLRNM